MQQQRDCFAPSCDSLFVLTPEFGDSLSNISLLIRGAVCALVRLTRLHRQQHGLGIVDKAVSECADCNAGVSNGCGGDNFLFGRQDTQCDAFS